MAGRGTGVPIYFGCAKCRLSMSPHASRGERLLTRVTRTGRTRPLRGPQRTNGPPRTLREQHEYKCTGCGHIGWSRHIDMLQSPIEPVK